MGKKLVVVESPAKAKTINKILGGEFVVKSSMGHVRDLPVKSLGIDIKNDFKMTYVMVKGRKKVIDDLKKAADSCDEIYLAPDPDREGEAIAWHLQAILRGGENRKKPFFRVQYNEITPHAVRTAFANPGKIDARRVDAQQARRALDRIVGYMVSPVLWRRIKRGLSAGRVQSVALRLVCEREDEIQKFVPEEYWIIGAKVRKLVAPRDPFHIRLVRVNGKKLEIKNAAQAASVRSDLDDRQLTVSDIATREISKRPFPPYITSSLQQAGSSYCGFSPHRTMSIAQKLYEGVDLGDGPVGLITYMRTDSFVLSRDALEACRGFIKEKYGPEFCPEKPNFYKNKANAQEAHEAIRPTDVNRTPDSVAMFLDPAEMKIYRLIWQRFVACQMVPARLELRTVKIDAVPKQGSQNAYTFQANASHVVFPGYMKATGIEHHQKDAESGEAHEQIPLLTRGEDLECLEWLQERKETQPPSRYSEASLVRALENNGVGRPSTYAQIISTLYNRDYVINDKKNLVPTETGKQVFTFLVASLNQLFDVGFTAAMEGSLDEVENGSVQWTSMLADFYRKFDVWLSAVKEPAADSNVVARIISELGKVGQWAQEVKRGKRTYGDKAFVESIGKQVESKPVSVRQLEALIRIALKYKDQVPDMENIVRAAGYERILAEPPPEPLSPATLRKLEILKGLNLGASAAKFTDSLRSQVEHGRTLSRAQIGALDKIILSNAALIPDLNTIKDSLEIEYVPAGEDKESGEMIAALSAVKQWKEPVTRRGKVFNDETFFRSLADHYTRKMYLSEKQKSALRKLRERYRDQAPGGDKSAQRPFPDNPAEQV